MPRNYTLNKNSRT